jgi:hypothetical protein
MFTSGHGGGLGPAGLLTTADFSQRRGSPDAETPCWFLSCRFAPSDHQSHDRFDREVAVNFAQEAIGADLGPPDRLRQQDLPADQRHVLAFPELQLL